MSFSDPTNPDAHGSSPKHRFFTNGAGQWTDANGTVYSGNDLDLQTIGGAAARTIVWVGDGTLDCVTASGSGTTEVGLSMPSGTSLDLQVTKIVDSSTCPSFLVMW